MGELDDLARRLAAELTTRGVWDLPDGWTPDLTDDATAGVLLGMLPAGTSALRTHDGWVVCVGLDSGDTGFREHEGATLGEACAHALLWEADDAP